MHVLIIGAGTGGLVLAHKLKSAGIEISVFERDWAPNADTGGYRVGISLPGSRALKACVPLENYDLYVATCAQPPRYFNMLTEQLKEVLCLEFGSVAADGMDGEKNVIRKTLRRVLLMGIEDRVSFGKGLISYAQNRDGTVTAHFADGSSATGDALVGADGSGSAVRKLLLPEACLEDTGMVSLRGKLPMSAGLWKVGSLSSHLRRAAHPFRVLTMGSSHNGINTDDVALRPVIFLGFLDLGGNPLPLFELGTSFDQPKGHGVKADRVAAFFDAGDAGRFRVRRAGRRICLAENKDTRFTK